MMRSDLRRVVEWFPIEPDNGYVDRMVCGMIPETILLVLKTKFRSADSPGSCHSVSNFLLSVPS
jgi:hypothetical protein